MPSTLTHLECSRPTCRAIADQSRRQNLCATCQAPLLARYDLATARRTLTRNALASRVHSMWRYEEVLPGGAPVTLGEGMTPLIHARRLGNELGLERLYIKEEGQNPTNSFKARGLSAAVTMAKALGVETIALPTAGNAGGAAAAYAARAGLNCVVAMPADTPAAIVLETRACGADVRLIDGLISDCGAFIAEHAATHGWYEVSTLKEPYRIEGKKTMGYELWEEFDGALPDVIVYPTGGGVGLIGMWKAFEELETMGLTGSHRPRMIAAQAEGCAPIVKAFEQHAASSVKWENATTVAAGLRVPKALGDFIILADIYESHGEAVAVSDEALMSACREMARLEGIFAAPEGGAGLAAIQKLVSEGTIGHQESIVLFNTGSGYKYLEAWRDAVGILRDPDLQ
ncbi:MAG TPA: threonine synthase [Vicinamibacterales bacterium]|nr:threonine synthase [Vicinamibacterales bacterium]